MVLAIFVLGVMVVYLTSQERSRNNDTQAALVRLCDTTTRLDISLVVPFLSETREVLEFLPPGPERRRAQRIAHNLTVAHAELSETTLCDRVR